MATKFTYTDTEVKEIVEKYNQGTSLEVLAEEYGKSVPSVPSVRMKLVKLGIYQKAGKPATASTSSPRKSEPAKAKTKSAVLTEFRDSLVAVGEALF